MWCVSTLFKKEKKKKYILSTFWATHYSHLTPILMPKVSIKCCSKGVNKGVHLAPVSGGYPCKVHVPVCDYPITFHAIVWWYMVFTQGVSVVYHAKWPNDNCCCQWPGACRTPQIEAAFHFLSRVWLKCSLFFFLKEEDLCNKLCSNKWTTVGLFF